jgi:hypothetical protein
MASSPVKIIFGGGGIGRYPRQTGRQFLEILEEHDVKEIDTAFVYVRSHFPTLHVSPV